MLSKSWGYDDEFEDTETVTEHVHAVSNHNMNKDQPSEKCDFSGFPRRSEQDSEQDTIDPNSTQNTDDSDPDSFSGTLNNCVPKSILKIQSASAAESAIINSSAPGSKSGAETPIYVSVPKSSQANQSSVVEHSGSMNGNLHSRELTQVLETQNALGQFSNMNSSNTCAKTDTNKTIIIPINDDGKQSSEVNQSGKPLTPPDNQYFLSPRSLAESLLSEHRDSSETGKQELASDKKDVHRSRSKQRKMKPMNALRSVSCNMRSVTKTRRPTSSDTIPGKSKGRDHSQESQNSNSK